MIAGWARPLWPGSLPQAGRGQAVAGGNAEIVPPGPVRVAGGGQGTSRRVRIPPSSSSRSMQGGSLSLQFEDSGSFAAQSLGAVRVCDCEGTWKGCI